MAALALAAVLLTAPGCGQGVTTSTVTTATTAVAPTTAVTPTTQPGPEEPSTTTEGPSVIKLGALFPLSGSLAAEGESALKGMRIALEEINAAGGIGALKGARLTLIPADSKSGEADADAEVARLVQTEGVVAIVGAGQSTVALEAADAAERLQTPFVVSSGAADEITEQGLAYTFRLCPKADWYARDQVAFLRALKDLAGLEITAVALLHAQGEYGDQTAKSQRTYLEKAGIQVVEDIEYPAEKADVPSEMLAIKGSGAQAILTATLLNDAALIAKDAATLNIDVPIIDAAGGMLDSGFIADAGTAAESMMSVAESAPGTAPSAKLEQELAGSGSEIDSDLLYGYQAVKVLASALERAGSCEGARLRLALKTTALYGDGLVLPQSLLTFDGEGQNRQARLLVMQVQDGKMVTVWPADYAHAAVR